MENKNLYISIFLSGFCLMLVEIGGARVLSPYLGTTIFIWASVIAFVLGALSIGYYLGGILADEKSDKKNIKISKTSGVLNTNKTKKLAEIMTVAAAGTLAIPILGKIITEITLSLNIILASIISSTILIPASIFYGMISPFAIKIAIQQDNEGKTSGTIFAVSTIGSIAGALTTGFLLIPNMQITHIFILGAVLMIFAAFILHNDGITKKYFIIFIITAFLTMNITYSSLIPGKVIADFDSEYYHVNIIKTNVSSNTTYLILDASFSSAEKNNGEPAFDYVRKSRFAYELLNAPKKALVIGVGAGTHIEELKKYFPTVIVYGIELDKKVINVAEKFFSLKEDAHTNIIINDARRYLRTDDKFYDIAIVDVYRGTTIPYHLLSKEFIKELKARMNNNSIVLVNLISTLEKNQNNAFTMVYNTYASEFKEIVIIPMRKDKPSELQNILIIASDRNLNEFKKANNKDIYEPVIENNKIITDELNPSELFITRWYP